MTAAGFIILAQGPDVRSPDEGIRDKPDKSKTRKAVRLNGIITHDAEVHETEEGIPCWFIEKKETREIVGYVKVTEYSDKNKTAVIKFYFLEGWRLEGTPEEVLTKIFEYLFNDRKFETVIADHYYMSESHTRDLGRVLTNVGMTKEAVLRNRKINSKGQKVDRIIYSILKEEWENIA